MNGLACLLTYATHQLPTFQALIDEMIGDLDFVAGLLDDIAIWGDTFEKLDQRVIIVFERLVKYNMPFNVRKFVIYVTNSVFLGFVISIDGVTADSSEVACHEK
jgi:hypothetical protein